LLFCKIVKNKTIFIAPLDWGIGHATRCVALIHQLVKDNTVIIGVTPSTKLIFDEEFPHLKHIEIEQYNIRYSKKLSLTLKLLLDAPRINKVIKKEHEQLKTIVKENNIDLIISDNRFGLCHQTVESIYITHQLNIQAGFFSGIANKIHHSFIKKFTKVWVPDFESEKESLAGKLSRTNSKLQIEYINPLSRLNHFIETTNKLDYLFLVSGPEPLRTQFENEIIHLINHSSKKIALVRGTTLPLQKEISRKVLVVNYANAKDLSELIASADCIVCRSGYSTLMDLHHLKKHNLVLIPTIGQTEQKYLADYWERKFNVDVLMQHEIINFIL
jgi:uncharacterized protein (TIGR00661 family)